MLRRQFKITDPSDSQLDYVATTLGKRIAVQSRMNPAISLMCVSKVLEAKTAFITDRILDDVPARCKQWVEAADFDISVLMAGGSTEALQAVKSWPASPEEVCAQHLVTWQYHRIRALLHMVLSLADSDQIRELVELALESLGLPSSGNRASGVNPHNTVEDLRCGLSTEMRLEPMVWVEDQEYVVNYPVGMILLRDVNDMISRPFSAEGFEVVSHYAEQIGANQYQTAMKISWPWIRLVLCDIVDNGLRKELLVEAGELNAKLCEHSAYANASSNLAEQTYLDTFVQAHELGHVLMGHCDTERGTQVERAIDELHADVVAAVITSVIAAGETMEGDNAAFSQQHKGTALVLGMTACIEHAYVTDDQPSGYPRARDRYGVVIEAARLVCQGFGLNAPEGEAEFLDRFEKAASVSSLPI